LFDSYRSLPQALVHGDYARHLSRFKAGDGISAAEASAFVESLRNEPNSDCILAVGQGSAINYLSQRRLPTRFYYFPVLVNARPPLPMAQRWVDWWVSDLQAADCRFVLVAQTVRKDWLNGPSQAAAALRRLLEGTRESGSLGAMGAIAVYTRK
jgi:hypothetical protein